MTSVLKWIFPEFFITSFGASRRKALLIGGVTLTFMAVVGVACFVLLGKEEKTARESATRFAAALLHNQPSAAPSGAATYVGGVRDYFGPISSAKVIGAHNKGVNTGDNADTRSFFVVEMLLAAKRGPAVIELEYDNHALLSEKVSRIYELKPSEAPSLTARERTVLDKAFAQRGGEPADAARLSRAQSTPVRVNPTVVPHAPRIRKPASMDADPRLRCVQKAHGDVNKLRECAAG